MFVHELSGLLQVPQSLSKYAAQTYDAMWAIALALRGAELKWQNDTTSQFRLDEFDYTRYDMAVEFLHQFSQMNFLGVSVCKGCFWEQPILLVAAVWCIHWFVQYTSNYLRLSRENIYEWHN